MAFRHVGLRRMHRTLTAVEALLSLRRMRAVMRMVRMIGVTWMRRMVWMMRMKRRLRMMHRWMRTQWAVRRLLVHSALLVLQQLLERAGRLVHVRRESHRTHSRSRRMHVAHVRMRTESAVHSAKGRW